MKNIEERMRVGLRPSLLEVNPPIRAPTAAAATAIPTIHSWSVSERWKSAWGYRGGGTIELYVMGNTGGVKTAQK